MVVILDCPLQVFLKSSIKQHFLINKYLYVSNIEHKSISVMECVVFYISLFHMLQNKDMHVDNLYTEIQ